jgi:hypothetical protein
LVCTLLRPNLSSKLSLMKLWVAPESNKTLTEVLLIENVPVSTGAPAGMSLMVVKFSLPWRTCTIGFLAGVAGLLPVL